MGTDRSERILDLVIYGGWVIIINSHIQPLLKDHLHGTQFSSDSDVIESVEDFFSGQDKLFYKAGIHKLQK